ncbi:hypothetical protein FRC11_012287 [Ceratobasidium sp. 423]|nr:hypothetical protein FRC11_012287 [Ceratobasidium sp. 423]
MVLLTRALPAFLSALSLVPAACAASCNDSGNDNFFSEFVGALNKHNLTILADNYEKIVKTEGGKQIVDILECGGELTLLAPNNRAFKPNYPALEQDVLLYTILWGSIDNDFKNSNNSLTRRAFTQSHTIAASALRLNSAGRKREDPQYQTQPIDQSPMDKQSSTPTPTPTPAPMLKRWYNSVLIQIERTVGTAKVVDRFTFGRIVILIIDTVLTLPTKVSDVLCKPLIATAPNGFTKFVEALRMTGLLDNVEGGQELTASLDFIFAPLDESLGDIQMLSKGDLSSLMKNHFLFGKRVFSPLFGGAIDKVTAESGEELKLSFENGVHYVCCGKSKAIVLRGDVITANGVLHVIDKPLKCN